MLGLPYIEEVNDCFQIARRHFEPLGINIRDYAFPSDFWDYDDDMYSRLFSREGFVQVDTDEWKPQANDVILVAGSIRVGFPTHLGIVQEDGRILHHYTGRPSELDAFKGIWRRPLMVLRHKSLEKKNIKPTITDITELVPAHVRARLTGRPQGTV